MVHDPRDLDETIPPEARGPCPAKPGEPPIHDTVTFQKPPSAQEECPRQIGRYHVESVLGKGGFGVVYLARDDQLQRHVAIKVRTGK